MPCGGFCQRTFLRPDLFTNDENGAILFAKSTSKGCDRLMGALREDAKYIYTRAIEAVLPDEAVRARARRGGLSGARDPRRCGKGGVAHGFGGGVGARRADRYRHRHHEIRPCAGDDPRRCLPRGGPPRAGRKLVLRRARDARAHRKSHGGRHGALSSLRRGQRAF